MIKTDHNEQKLALCPVWHLKNKCDARTS